MNRLEDSERQYRVATALAALTAGCAAVGLLTLALPAPAADAGGFSAAALLLDRGSAGYPLTIQNAMWLLFFFGLGELWVRLRRARSETEQFFAGLLPEDESSMLRAKDLAPIYRAVRVGQARYYRLQRLIVRVVQQFQVSRSIDKANGLLNSSLELMQHEIELKYNMLRYLVWLIPTLGFIGTVIGIALALSAASALPNLDTAEAEEITAWFTAMTAKLGVAFSTTLVALVMSAVLVFLLHVVEGKEEAALNGAGQYCLDNLINRLYEE